MTLVEGSTDAHLVQVLTDQYGQTAASINEDCVLSDSFAACAYVMKDTAGSVIQSAAATNTVSVPTASATSKNGASRIGVAAASVLAIVAAGVMLVDGMV